jgi:hypothetical protein
MGRVFQVRFTAMGENAFNVIRWNVDNINIYRACNAPVDLVGDYDYMGEDDFGAMLYWQQPFIPEPPSGWIRWDNGVNFTAVGLTDGTTFSVAARWEPPQLEMYVGASITQMQFFLADAGFDSIVMKIWTGPNANTMVYEAGAVNPVAGQWNVYAIDPPVALNVEDEVWIGYTVLGQALGATPAGADEGPAEAGYGDLLSTDGTNWDNASDLGLDYNWNLAAYVETLDGQIESIGNGGLIDNTVYNNNSNEMRRGPINTNGVAFEDTKASRDFTGFNIYRMGPGQTEYMFLTNVAWIDGTPDYSYYDENPFGDVTTLPYTVCYQVTAVWESDTDMCESAPAMAFNDVVDYVCMVITDVDNPLAGEVTNLYPNPATNRATVSSSQAISHVTIVNYVGQVVYNAEVGQLNKVELNTANYDAGMYIVRITTESGIITKRLAIAN